MGQSVLLACVVAPFPLRSIFCGPCVPAVAKTKTPHKSRGGPKCLHLGIVVITFGRALWYLARVWAMPRRHEFKRLGRPSVRRQAVGRWPGLGSRCSGRFRLHRDLVAQAWLGNMRGRIKLRHAVSFGVGRWCLMGRGSIYTWFCESPGCQTRLGATGLRLVERVPPRVVVPNVVMMRHILELRCLEYSYGEESRHKSPPSRRHSGRLWLPSCVGLHYFVRP